ncbi:predicted protein [Uncinocarpus reesii 1704]|uniref:Uncharacterized protein n=1 Tax=Uncinocarpus reesii (strain UAMH 1704) TaxID=336963 RepID=C4JHS6_UNCRE|nr:uncharacterized protein UREG_02762 [Uncinocarpus reesii 1704]EEP77913.1 predicted protein [Uncinocarpus reesii 1704]
MRASLSGEAAGQDSKEAPKGELFDHLETTKQAPKSGKLGNLYHRLVNSQRNRPSASSECGVSELSGESSATKDKQKRSRIRRIMDKMQKLSGTGNQPEIEPEQSSVGEQRGNEELPLLSVCSDLFTQEEWDDLREFRRDYARVQQEKRDKASDPYPDANASAPVDPPTKEQLASLARREREKPNPFINSPVPLPAIQEPDNHPWTKGLYKTAYKPTNPTMLSPAWLTKKKRGAAKGARLHKNSKNWGPEDFEFRDLLRGMLDDETLEKIMAEDDRKQGKEPSASSKFGEDGMRNVLHVMLDRLIDKTVEELI